MKINEITKEDFQQYESLRQIGITNMLDWNAVSKYLSWNYVSDKEKYLFILKNYGKLKNM